MKRLFCALFSAGIIFFMSFSTAKNETEIVFNYLQNQSGGEENTPIKATHANQNQNQDQTDETTRTEITEEIVNTADNYTDYTDYTEYTEYPPDTGYYPDTDEEDSMTSYNGDIIDINNSNNIDNLDNLDNIDNSGESYIDFSENPTEPETPQTAETVTPYTLNEIRTIFQQSKFLFVGVKNICEKLGYYTEIYSSPGFSKTGISYRTSENGAFADVNTLQGYESIVALFSRYNIKTVNSYDYIDEYTHKRESAIVFSMKTGQTFEQNIYYSETEDILPEEIVSDEYSAGKAVLESGSWYYERIER